MSIKHALKPKLKKILKDLRKSQNTTDGKRLGQRKLKQTWDATTSEYEKACIKIGYANSDIRGKYLDDDITEEEYKQRYDDLDVVYREGICRLPTIILQYIITANETRQQKRAQRTINSVATELLERELFDGSN